MSVRLARRPLSGFLSHGGSERAARVILLVMRLLGSMGGFGHLARWSSFGFLQEPEWRYPEFQIRLRLHSENVPRTRFKSVCKICCHTVRDQGCDSGTHAPPAGYP